MLIIAVLVHIWVVQQLESKARFPFNAMHTAYTTTTSLHFVCCVSCVCCMHCIGWNWKPCLRRHRTTEGLLLPTTNLHAVSDHDFCRQFHCYIAH